MACTRADTLLRHIRMFAEGRGTAEFPDGELVRRFAEKRDEAALDQAPLTRLKMSVSLILALTALAAGIGVTAPTPWARGEPPHRTPESATPPVQAQTRPKPGNEPPARADRYGDPLPEGVVARLGTVRLRPGGRIKRLAFSPDGQRLASWVEDFSTASRLSIWEAATGRELRQVALPDVRTCAFTWLANGRGVAVLQLGDNSFYVWDFTDAKAEHPPLIHRPRLGIDVEGDQEQYRCFAIAPDGKSLAAGSSGTLVKERPIHVWELATGRRLTDFQPPRLLGQQPGNCTALAFTPDSRGLVVLSGTPQAKEEKLVLWNVAGGEKRQEMTIPATTQQDFIKVYAPASDGRTVVLGLPDGTARLWDMKLGQEQRSLAVNIKGPTEQFQGVSAVAFSPDGTVLTTGSRDNALRVWNLAGGKEVRTLRGHHAWIEALAVSPDGNRIASAGQDGVIRLWDSTTGADACPLDGHGWWVTAVAVSPDGKTAATVSWDGARLWDGVLRLFEVATGRETRRIELGNRPGETLSFTPDGKALAASTGNRFHLWEAATGKTLQPPASLADHSCKHFRFAGSGKMLLTAYEEKVAIWEWPSGRPVRTLQLPAHESNKGRTICTRLALSDDSRLLVTLGTEIWQGGKSVGHGTVDLWDVSTGERLRRLASSLGTFQDAAFTSDGSGLLLARSGLAQAGGPDGTKALAQALSLLDLNTGQVRRTFAAPASAQAGDSRIVKTLARSPDGRMLVSAEGDGTVLLFELATGLRRRELVGHRGGVTSVGFTSDGKRLVTGSFDNTALVWDVGLEALGHKTGPDVAQLWVDLGSSEPGPANYALAGLAGAPELAISFLKDRLQPSPAANAALLDRLVADLDSDQFDVREKASARLDRLGETAIDGARQRAAQSNSEEVRQRLARFLAKHDPEKLTTQHLRELRGVEVLEQIGTPEARAVLTRLAKGPTEARLTQHSKAALDRLARRSEVKH
jgi:WD40 repeat protein